MSAQDQKFELEITTNTLRNCHLNYLDLINNTNLNRGLENVVNKNAIIY